jgi:hypothetical protein
VKKEKVLMSLKPLTPKKETDKRESWGRVVRDTPFNREETGIFSAMKVPRQCPLVLLLKVD